MAAEVLGMAYSGFAIASAGSGFGKTAIAIKRLRDTVKDAPDQMQWLSDQLCVLQPLVADLEALLLNNPIPSTSNTASTSCIQLYSKAMQNLSDLADDLKADLSASHWSKRVKAKVKIAMEQDRLRLHQERLNTAVQILMVCYQKYTASLILSQHLVAVKPVIQQESESSVIQTQHYVSCPHGCVESSRNSTFWDTTSQLRWLSPGYFARFRYKTQTFVLETGSCDVSHLQLQLPFWLSSSMWDVYIRRACFGWKVALRPVTIRDFDSKFRETIWNGTNSDLFKIISEQRWSVHDRDTSGQTMLDLAIMNRNYDFALGLIRAGARLDDADDLGPGTFSRLCQQRGRAGRLEVFQELSGLGILEDLLFMRVFCYPTPGHRRVMYPRANDFAYAVWGDVALYDLVVAVSGQDAPKVLWTNLSWWCVEPSTALELLKRQNFHESEEFRISSQNASPSNIQCFSGAYFGGLRANQRNTSFTNEWRKVCRMIIRHVPLAALSSKALPRSVTPLLKGLQSLYDPYPSPKRVRQSVERLLKCWLEDLQAVDKDLDAYGRSEASMLAYQERWAFPSLDGTLYYSPCIHSLEFGPSWEDWRFHWDYFQPEYAREFWQYIETERPRMPGSWVD